MLSADALKSRLSYDPETGVFRRLSTGRKAGTVRPNGYIQIGVDGKLYRAHRLAWLLVHGHFPESDIDHINRDRADNRIANLRLATRSENMCNRSIAANNSSGVTGVCWDASREKWLVQIKRKGAPQKNLGRYATLEEAAAVRANAEQRFFGAYAP